MTRWARISLVAVLGVIAASAPQANAAEIELVAGNVGASTVYDAGTGTWSVNSTLSGTSVLGGAFFYEMGSPQVNASFAWQGNPRVADTSAGGQASAVFGPGGTLTVYGKLYQFGIEIFDGMLMAGSVSGFGVHENTTVPNFIDMDPTAIFTPVAGVLVDGTFGLEMTLPYELSFTGGDARQSGGDLVDFQTSVTSVGTFQWNMTPVPEPTVGLLLLAGLGLVARRSR